MRLRFEASVDLALDALFLIDEEHYDVEGGLFEMLGKKGLLKFKT